VNSVGAADNVVCNGSINFLTTELFFEPETPFSSLKGGPPTWDEVEQLLDNPYAVTTGCSDSAGVLPRNDQGFPSYCTNPNATFFSAAFIRRPGIGVTLPPMLVHPLNQNPATGAEMRLINPNFAQANFNNTNVCYTLGIACAPAPSNILVSSGASRLLPTADAHIDYVLAVGRKAPFCQVNPEPVPLGGPLPGGLTFGGPFDTSFGAENLTACGSDSGEPGAIPYFFPVFQEDNLGLPLNTKSTTYYSTPAVPAPSLAAAATMQIAHGLIPGSTTGTSVPVVGPLQFLTGFRLTDPGNRGVINPRNLASGVGGLRKPSLRVQDIDGTGLNGSGTDPNYLVNTDPNTTHPSNENDYVGLYPSGLTTNANYAARKHAARLEAMVLGKSLFWDMQVGSDAIQACGSCHVHAGADNRTKNQINPNGQDGIKGLPTNFEPNAFTFPPNYDLQAKDFPFHDLKDPDVAGDPLCTPAIMANVAGITFPDGDPPDNPKVPSTFPVCDAANIKSDTDDVASSMGVKFGKFYDVPGIGAASFGPGSIIGGVKSLLPDMRSPAGVGGIGRADDNVDPIPGFAGTGNPLTDDGSGHQFRRVEPRNTPTIFLADFNFDNFWDGRARHDDNGGSVFGAADPQAHVWVTTNLPSSPSGTLTATRQIIKFSSLGALAKGPGLSKFEMSFDGRNWAKVGKKLLQNGVTPLANQLVDPNDSILGRYSNQNGAACAALPNVDRSPAGPAGHGVTTLGPGVPGLCISYPGLIRHSFYAALWQNASQHLDGCYTDGRLDLHPNQCGTGAYPAAAISVLDGDGVVRAHNKDPFDDFVLSLAAGPAAAADTNQFNQMEANFSLFWGQSIHLWATLLVPDDTPWDQWLDRNPDGGFAMGESGEPLLVLDMPNCVNNVPGAQPPGYTRGPDNPSCFTEFGNFKRDPYNPNDIVHFQNDTAGHPRMTACLAETTIGGIAATRVCTNRVPAGGTRQPSAPDPLLGMDIFFGSNTSLKNPNFRSARCGACHNAPTLTDNTTPFTHKTMLVDPAPEFERSNPVIEPLMEPLGHQRIISGFLLESEINAPGQDAIERKIVNESIVPAPVVNNNRNCGTASCSGYSFPDAITAEATLDATGHAISLGYRIHADLGTGPIFGAGVPVPFTSFGGSFFDNGVYNIGVRPCVANQSMVIGACEDNGRGNTDAFGWPLSLAALLMKNLGGPAQEPGTPIPAVLPDGKPGFDPSADPGCAPYCATGGLFDDTAHDQQINPGSEDEVVNPQLPAYLAPFANKITVGDAHPQVDEAGGPVGGMVNTLTDVANAEGFPEIPFDPRANLSEVTNAAYAPGDSTIGGPGAALQGTWPMVNRVSRFGSFKAPQLREIELTGPYFHNGGKLTLRQVVDFYVRGGDFPVTNSQHRDFNILNLNAELQSDLSEEEKVALVDFLLELTDPRVRFEKGPFDHPEMILPLDGTARENGNFGGLAFRDAILGIDAAHPTGTNCVASPLGPGHRACNKGEFLDAPAVGNAGTATPEPNFLGIASGPRLVGAAAFCSVANNQYCH
jgi:cytochrome c peroxidase